MDSKIRIVCLIINLCATASGASAKLYNIDDADCKIRFYELPNYQGSSWTYDGILWSYKEDCHPYSCSGIIPNRSKFVPESVRTFADKPENCNTWIICSKKRIRHGRKNMQCTNLTPDPNDYPDIRRWDIGRHKIQQWSIGVTKVSFTKPPVFTSRPFSTIEKMTGTSYTCTGKKCNKINTAYTTPPTASLNPQKQKVSENEEETNKETHQEFTSPTTLKYTRQVVAHTSDPPRIQVTPIKIKSTPDLNNKGEATKESSMSTASLSNENSVTYNDGKNIPPGNESSASHKETDLGGFHSTLITCIVILGVCVLFISGIMCFIRRRKGENICRGLDCDTEKDEQVPMNPKQEVSITQEAQVKHKEEK